jgi:archaellum biogenesis ATPase FlaH/5S rRNA maturation endonuclease (ribonuclease M5)
VAEFNVIAYLATKGYTGKQANGPEVVYPCFFDCNEPAHSSKKKLYVNSEDGWYSCKVCSAAGGTYLLQEHFGDDPHAKIDHGPDPTTRRRLLREATKVGQDWLDQNDDILLWLIDERGLDHQTILNFKLGFVEKGWSLSRQIQADNSKEELKTTGLVWRDGPRDGQDFFYDHILIPYLSRGSAVQIRGRQNPFSNASGGKYMTGPGDDAFLFNQDALDGAEDVIITEGEFDCMALTQHLATSTEERIRRIAVVGLAGVEAHPPNFLNYFTNTKRVYIGFDSDEAGKRAAEKLKETFGARGRIVELPTNLVGKKCDWSEYLLPAKPNASEMWCAEHPFRGHDWRDVSNLLAEASGKRIKSMSEIGVSYRALKVANPNGLKLGYDEIDRHILPGVLPGQVVVILANTGVGKTLLLCNLAFNMRHRHVLFISLEMTSEEVYERMRRLYLFHYPHASDEQLETNYSRVFVCDENRLGERDFDMLVAEYELETGARPEIVLVDYLQYYARGAKGNSPYEKASNAIMQLKAEAKQGKFSVFVPSQVNRGTKDGKPLELSDGRDAGTIEETADFVLGLHKPDNAQNPQETAHGVIQSSGKMYLKLLKSRHGGKDRRAILQMDPLSLVIVADGTREAQRAREHMVLETQEFTWESMRADELRRIGEGEQLGLTGLGTA